MKKPHGMFSLLLAVICLASIIVEPALASPTPTVGQPPREMTSAEKTAWVTAKTLGSAAGSTIGSAVGVVVVPAAITAIVGALGISTSGAGFVSAVLIPYSPVIGKFLGSAIGTGLFSVIINTGYELRMQKFRAQPKSGKDIARTVAKTAFTEALMGAVTLGLGGGAGAAAGSSLKTLIWEMVKSAGIRLVGEGFMRVLVGKAMPTLPGPESPTTPEGGEPPAGTAANLPNEDSPVIPGQGRSSQRPGDVSSEGASDESVRNGSGAEGSGSGEEKVNPGFSKEVEAAARISMISGYLSRTAAVLPGTLAGGLGMTNVVVFGIGR